MMKKPTLRQMMRTLISAHSVSSTHQALDTSNRSVIEPLATWLEDLGFHIELQPIPEQNDKLNLIASLGEGEDGLVFSGHTDTVPYDDHLWNSDPLHLSESNNQFYGLGTSDMKGFFACLLHTLHSLNLNSLEKPLVILATADEESTMSGARFLQQQNRTLGKYCVIGEPTGLKPIRQHKGIFMEAVELIGMSGHSSDPTLGNNALEGMHQVIDLLMIERQQLGAKYQNHDFIIPVPTLNIGHIHGGDNANRICGDCVLHYDLRLLPGMDLKKTRDRIRAGIQEIAEQRALQCRFLELFEGVPALTTAPYTKLVKTAESISGHQSQSVAFATEGPFLQSLGMDVIILGPGNISVAHKPNEHVSHADLMIATKIYQSMIQSLCT